MSTERAAVPEIAISAEPVGPRLKRFPARRPKAPVEPRIVAEDTLKRYPKTIARLAE